MANKTDWEEEDETNRRDHASSNGCEAVVDQYLRQTVADHQSIRDIIIAENQKNLHDKPSLDTGTMVTKFRKYVHLFGHLGKCEVEVVTEVQKAAAVICSKGDICCTILLEEALNLGSHN